MRDQISELLQKNIFLSEKLKEKILSHYQTFDESKIEQLIKLLEKAQSHQKSFLEKALKKNPGFFQRVKMEASLEFKKKLFAQEELSRIEDNKELEELENELNSLFE